MKQLLLKFTVRCVVVIIFLVSAMLASGQTVPDSTYGSGGTKTTSSTKHKDGSTEEKIIIKDKNGIVREEKTTTVNDRKEEIESTDYFDGNGKKTQNKQLHKDVTGKEIYNLDEKYKDGVITSGELTEDFGGKKVVKKYNPKTEKYEPVEGSESGPDNFNFPDFKNDVTIAFSLINEDSYKRFNTYGGNVIYTHHLSNHFGITGDAGIYFGLNSGMDFTKIQFLGGITVFTNAHNNKIMFSPHLLAGIVHLRSNYGTSNSGSTGLAAAAGIDAVYNLNNKTGIAVRADYNPTFFGNSVQHNFKLSTGLTLRFGN